MKYWDLFSRDRFPSTNAPLQQMGHHAKDVAMSVDPPWCQANNPHPPSSPIARVLRKFSPPRASTTPPPSHLFYRISYLIPQQTPRSPVTRAQAPSTQISTALRLLPRPGAGLNDTPKSTASPPLNSHNRSTTQQPRPAAAAAARKRQVHPPNHVVVAARERRRCRRNGDNRIDTAVDPSPWVASELQSSPAEEPSAQARMTPSRDDSGSEAKPEESPAEQPSAQAKMTPSRDDSGSEAEPEETAPSARPSPTPLPTLMLAMVRIIDQANEGSGAARP